VNGFKKEYLVQDVVLTGLFLILSSFSHDMVINVEPMKTKMKEENAIEVFYDMDV